MKRIIRKRTAAERSGVSTRTIDRWVSDPKYAYLNFPKPVPIGANSVGFLEEEHDRWVESRAKARDEQAQPEGVPA